MEKFTLTAELRDTETKLSDIRADKKVPSVVYGHKFESKSVTVEYSEFLKVFRKTGKTHLVELILEGKKQNVLIHDVQKHPVTGDFLHADFFVVSSTEKIHVQVPLTLVGESRAQKEGSVTEQNMHSVEVKCLPQDLVDSFEVDMTRLAQNGDSIHVRDLAISNKFEILSPIDGSVISVHAPKGGLHEESDVAQVEIKTEKESA